MKKIFIFLIFLSLISFLFSPFISLLLPGSLRDHAYREIIFHVIANEETKGLKNKTEIAKTLFFYTTKNTLLNPGSLIPYDDKELGYLIKGLVFCDYEADILATLCAQKGIPARYIMLKDKDGISPHTMDEILLEGKWRVFDPAEICYYTTNSGELAILQDLSQNPDLIAKNKRMQIKGMPEIYKKMFPIPQPPQHSVSKIKHITLFDRIDFLWYDLWKETFLKFYQDAYLAIKTEDMEKREKLYYLARNYHLAYRTQKAIQAYNDFIKTYPHGLYANRVVLFLAFVYMDQKNDYRKAAEILSSLVSRPEDIYEKYALYYIGKCYELLNNQQEAQEYFYKSGLFVALDPSLAN